MITTDDGCKLHVRIDGRDDAPALMLSNSLGCTLDMWEPQIAAFTTRFRVVRYDRRGHGQSDVPDGPYSMPRFGQDVIAILDALAIKRAHWCGLSMGGMVGQWLGANASERFDRIVLSNTACHYPDPTNWHNRIKAVTEGGLKAVADTVIAGWLTEAFRAREPDTTSRVKAMLLASPVKGYLACCKALSTLDQRALLPAIKRPTLVIAGRHDKATPVEAGEVIRDGIPGAAMMVLDAAHISNIEQSAAFTEAVLGFLKG
ncbi:MAG: pcaD [Tardiphaga sp.]|nr:pcaD [Tardiphaga sp.]